MKDEVDIRVADLHGRPIVASPPSVTQRTSSTSASTILICPDPASSSFFLFRYSARISRLRNIALPSLAEAARDRLAAIVQLSRRTLVTSAHAAAPGDLRPETWGVCSKF